MSLSLPKILPAVSLTPVNNFSALSLTPAINCSPVSLTPVINCSPVSTTPPIKFYNGDKLDWWQRSVLSAKISPPKLLQTKTTAPHLLLVTGNKFIASVVFTGDNCSPMLLSPSIKISRVSLSPAINCSAVSMTLEITENLWQRLIAGVFRRYHWQRWTAFYLYCWHRW